MSHVAALMLATFALACVPQLRGECDGDEACPLGTQCVEGLCLAAIDDPFDGGHEATDGGDEPRCPDECPDECNEALACEPTPSEPTIEIISPVATLLRAAPSLSVLVRARAPGGVEEVSVTLDDLVSVTLAPSTDADTFAGRLDVPALTHGDHTLLATMRWSGGEASTATSLSFDARGPTIVLEPLAYPRVRAGLGDAFGPGDPIEIYALIEDHPAGLQEAPVLVEGGRRTPGEALGDGRWRFALKAPTPAQAEVVLSLTVEASDAVGNLSSSEPVQTTVSRQVWRWQPPTAVTITAAPALVGDLVVFGDADGVLTALRQSDGTLVWQAALDAAIVGHVSAALDPDALTVHAVTRSGHVYWIDAGEDRPASERVLSRCQGRAPAAGASVVGDTLFVVSRDGYLQLLRPVGDDACVREHRLPKGAGVSAASLSPRAGGVDVYVATPDGGIHRVDVDLAPDGTPAFADAWTQPIATQDAVRGAPALGTVDTRTSIVVGTDNSRVFGGYATGQDLSISGKLLSSAIIAGPALVAGDAYFIDQDGEAQRVRLDTGKKQWTPAFRGLPRGPDALAGPVVGRSGHTCLTTGARLSCVTPAGVVRWRHDEPGGHALDAVTPVLGCDGRLFVASAAGTIAAFATDTNGPADGWSRPGGDARNTSNLAAPGWCLD